MVRASKVAPRLLTGPRFFFALIFALAAVLGYFGLRQYLGAPQSPWDLLYYDLQLFVLSSTPLEHPGPYPAMLAVARFLAPAATLYAVFEATRALLAGNWRRGHVIVTGDTGLALALVERFRDGRQRLVQLHEPDAESLRAAGIGGASALYACSRETADQTVNVLTALTAVNAPRRRWRKRPLRVYAQVSDATLALALRARRFGLPASADRDIEFFNVDELAAKSVLDLDSVSVPADQPPWIVVAGGSHFGQAVVIEYAGYWKLYSPRRAERVRVSLVDPEAGRVVAELQARSETVADVLDLVPVTEDLATFLGGQPELAPHRVYVCHDSEAVAMREALLISALLRGGKDSVVVRLDQLYRTGPRQRSSGNRTARYDFLVGDLGGRIRLIDVTEPARSGAIEQDNIERLAQAIHASYQAEQALDPTGVALVPWDRLAEDYRNANRAQARDIGIKLSLVGCTVAPQIGPAEAFSFGPDEVETLAVHEHERWNAERRAAGWRYGEIRDNRRRRHPSLVAWAVLPESEREKDREAVRRLPAVLAQTSMRVVRLFRD